MLLACWYSEKGLHGKPDGNTNEPKFQQNQDAAGNWSNGSIPPDAFGLTYCCYTNQTTYLLQQTRRPYSALWAATDGAIQLRIFWVTQDAGIKGSTTTIHYTILMKHYSFRLTDEEQQIIDVVTKNSKYRHFKDPKVIYMNAAMDVLKQLAR